MTDWNPKAHKIFLDAAEIVDARERERFVCEQCERDAELLREVKSFLSANQPAAEYFGRATGAMQVPHDEELTRDSLRAGEGDVIGRYRLLQTIGEGGFGVVYMAEQAQPVRRKVALKVIKPGMDTREVIARFGAERQALALMNHPNIAKVLDAGETKDGRPFFVMELVRGIPITEYCDKNNLHTKERLELFSTVCSAVQHAHQKGVIHRDIKPANVMVTLHDGEPVTKVIDFGIAKAISQRLTEQTIFTRYGQMIGTPQYMSPEQAEMSGIDVDTRSDIYSLGVLLYELLTGSTPIQLARIRDVGMKEMLRLIQEEDSPKPSQRLSSIGEELSIVARKRKAEPTRFCRMVRGELDWIVMKAIEKDRRRRYETASAFAGDIQHYLNGETVEAVAPTAGYRLRKFVARHQIYVTTGLLLVLTLLAATGFSIRQALIARNSQQAADTARRVAQAAGAEEAIQRAEAERQARVVRQLVTRQRQQLYASDMHRAYRYLSDGNLKQVRAILEHYLTPDGDLGDMRGFEWKYLWDRSRSEELGTFNANGHAVVASANGEFLAISEFEKIAIREQVAPWKIVHTVNVPHTASLSFSGDGKFLAAARDQVRDPENRQDITILDTATWSIWKHLPNATYPMTFSQDGKWFAYRYPDGELRDHLQLVRVADWNKQSHFPMGYLAMDWWQGRMQLEFSPDSRLLMFLPPIVQGESPRERTWQFLRMPEQEKDQALSQLIPASLAITVSPDGTHLATSAGEKLNRIDVYDLLTSSKIATLDNHTSYVMSLEYSADGKHLVSGEFGMKLITWDTVDYRKVKSYGAGNSFDLAITADSRYAVNTTLVEPRSAKVWSIQRTNTTDVTGYPVGLTQSGGIVTIELNGQVKVWKDTTLVSTFESRLGRPLGRRACVTSDDRLLTASDDSSCVNVWDLKGHQVAPVPVGQAGQVRRIASNPANPDIVVVSTDAGHVAAWSIARRQEMRSILRDFKTFGLVFSDDGESLAIVGHAKTLKYEDMVLRVFDVGQDQVGQRFRRPGRYESVSFSANRKYIAAGKEGHFDVLDGETGKLLKQISAGSDHVSFSPDGKTLATVGSASNVKLWHVPSWIEMLELESPNAPAVFFDRSSSARLIIGSHLREPVRDIDLRGVVTHSDSNNGPSGESPL